MSDESVQEALDKADRVLARAEELTQQVHVKACENIAVSLGLMPKEPEVTEEDITIIDYQESETIEEYMDERIEVTKSLRDGLKGVDFKPMFRRMYGLEEK